VWTSGAGLNRSLSVIASISDAAPSGPAAGVDDDFLISLLFGCSAFLLSCLRMPRWPILPLLLAAVLLLLTVPVQSHSSQLSLGFTKMDDVHSFDSPIALAFASNGTAYIVEQNDCGGQFHTAHSQEHCVRGSLSISMDPSLTGWPDIFTGTSLNAPARESAAAAVGTGHTSPTAGEAIGTSAPGCL